jgi:hypothetical protein
MYERGLIMITEPSAGHCLVAKQAALESFARKTLSVQRSKVFLGCPSPMLFFLRLRETNSHRKLQLQLSSLLPENQHCPLWPGHILQGSRAVPWTDGRAKPLRAEWFAGTC